MTRRQSGKVCVPATSCLGLQSATLSTEADRADGDGGGEVLDGFLEYAIEHTEGIVEDRRAGGEDAPAARLEAGARSLDVAGINRAFFQSNAFVSAVFLVAVCLDRLR